jgi:hypothetical protein
LSMAVGVPLVLAALALMVAILGMAMFAYYRFRWMRFVALSAWWSWRLSCTGSSSGNTRSSSSTT